MSEKPYTTKGEIMRLIAEAVPGQKIKRIKFNNYGGVDEVEWYEAPPDPKVQSDE
jgi:hypothetical protein